MQAVAIYEDITVKLHQGKDYANERNKNNKMKRCEQNI